VKRWAQGDGSSGPWHVHMYDGKSEENTSGKGKENTN